MDPVVQFEMPYENKTRMTAFYEKVFGWQTKALGEAMGNYVLATSSVVDGEGLPVQGTVNGGFFPKRPDMPHPSVVIAVADMAAAIANVRKAGGKVQGEPLKIPGVGLHISFYDTEGNRVSMMQAAT